MHDPIFIDKFINIRPTHSGKTESKECHRKTEQYAPTKRDIFTYEIHTNVQYRLHSNENKKCAIFLENILNIYIIANMNRKVLMVNSGLVILLFLIISKAISIVIAMGLSSHFTTNSSKVPLSQNLSPAPPLFESHAVILTSGLMGASTRGQLTPLAVPSKTPTGQSATAPQDIVLLGTVQGVGKNSFILVKRVSTNEEQVFRIGEKIYDLGTLIKIQKETATVRTASATVTLYPPNQTPPSNSPGNQTATGITSATQNENGIIDKLALVSALDNIGSVMTDARLIPSMKDGKVEGFKVSEVKPKGSFGMIGLKNNDVLIKVNDFTIDAPEKAIQTLLSLKGQTRLKIDLIRNGNPITLSYDIR